MHRQPEQFLVCIDHALELEMSLESIRFPYDNTKIIAVYHICPNTRCAMRELNAEQMFASISLKFISCDQAVLKEDLPNSSMPWRGFGTHDLACVRQVP